MVGDNASTQKGKVNGLLANNARIFGKEMFFVGCYPHVVNIMMRRMCQARFGTKGDMSNPHVLQLLYNISWLHHERSSQYKVMYVSLGILNKEPYSSFHIHMSVHVTPLPTHEEESTHEGWLSNFKTF